MTLCFHFPISTEDYQLPKTKDVSFRLKCALVWKWISLMMLCVTGKCFSRVEPRSGIPRSMVCPPWIFTGDTKEPSKAVLVDFSPYPTHSGYQEGFFGWFVLFYSLREKNDAIVWFPLAARETELHPLLLSFCSYSLTILGEGCCIPLRGLYSKHCDIDPSQVVSKIIK